MSDIMDQAHSAHSHIPPKLPIIRPVHPPTHPVLSLCASVWDRQMNMLSQGARVNVMQANRVRDTEVLVKAMSSRHELGLRPKMPLKSTMSRA